MRKRNGITLIALIVTIIVLLILAGVSIFMVSGDKGIVTKAKKSAEETDINNDKELISLVISEFVLEDNLESGKYTNYAEIFRKMDWCESAIENVELGGTVVKMKDCTHEYLVSNDGNIRDTKGIFLNKNVLSLELIYDEIVEEKISVILNDIDGDVVWSISNNEVASISVESENEIVVTALSRGTAIITATCGSYSSTCKVVVSKELAIGEFIKYDISYTDVYGDYKYTSDNGWRYIGKDDNDNYLIISTGIPALLPYNCNIAQSWWDENESLNPSVRMTNGLKNNFLNIDTLILADGTVISGLYFKNEIAQNVTVLEATTGTSTIKMPDGWLHRYNEDTGLYYLNTLKSLNGMSSYDYTFTWYYWLASPYETGSNIIKYVVCTGFESGNYTGVDRGVRPVIVLPKDIDINSLIVD